MTPDKPNVEAMFEETVPTGMEPENEPTPKIHAGQHLLLSAYWFGSNFVWGALLGVVIASQMETLAPLTKAQTLGLLYSIGAFPALVIPLIAGALSDRCTSKWGRRRPYMLGGGIIALIGMAGMLFASHVPSINLYFGAYFIVQFGSNTALAAYSGVIPDMVPHDQRGTASGYMAFMSQSATLVGAFLGGKFIKDSDTTVYLLLIGVFAVFLALALYGLKEKPLDHTPEKLEWIPYLKSLWIDPKQYPDFAWVWITRALMMLGFYAIQPYILYYLRDMVQVKQPETQAGLMIAVILVGATVSGIVGGAISDKTGRKPVVYASSMIIAVMALTFIFCHDINQVMLCGVLFGLGYGAYISVDWALGTDVLPNKEHAGKDMAVWHVSMTLPQQVAPLLAGSMLQLFVVRQSAIDTTIASYSRNGYAVVFGFSAMCFMLGGILLRNVRGVK